VNARYAAELLGVSFVYPRTSTPIFVDVDLRIALGERIALTGPSGAGKSTLLNILGVLEPVSSGEYHLAGEPVHSASASRRAQLRATHVGFVFQSFHLLSFFTALENVALGSRYRPDSDRDRLQEAEELLSRVGLAGFGEARPGELSGGQQQRVAIARALAGRPGLLLCDEPTGNLDDESSDVVLSALNEVPDQATSLVVATHDERVAARLDRTIRVEAGAVVSS
jgi:putative ABC transport system ATP-binding protein